MTAGGGDRDHRPSALLCDVDGVLRHYDPDRNWSLERDYGLPSGTIDAVAFDGPLLTEVITGRLAAPGWHSVIVERLAGRLGSARARELVSRWRSPGTVDARALDIVVAAARLVPVVLVTNGSTDTERDLWALGIARPGIALVNSARLGTAKPAPAIYRHAAEMAGVAPGQCVFVDDVPENLEPARALGMLVVHYGGLADLHRAVRALTGGDGAAVTAG